MKVIHCVTHELQPFDFLYESDDFEIAWLVCLQNKICQNAFVRQSFSKLHLEINRWHNTCVTMSLAKY